MLSKTVALVALAALLTATAASAHRYNRPVFDYQERAELRMSAFRLEHGASILFPTVSTYLMAVALNEEDYRKERLIGFSVGGQPFATWSLQFIPAGFSAGIIKSYRCFGRPYTPYQAIRRIGNTPRLRSIMLDPNYIWGSTRVVKMHAHKGYLKGKGRCLVYYHGFGG
jgi:hypothetical protein